MKEVIREADLEDYMEDQAGCSKEVWLTVDHQALHHISLQDLDPITLLNLLKKVLYRFLIPNDIDSINIMNQRRDRFELQMRDSSIDVDQYFKFKTISSQMMGIILPMAIYDPNLRNERCWYRHQDGMAYRWLMLPNLINS